MHGVRACKRNANKKFHQYRHGLATDQTFFEVNFPRESSVCFQLFYELFYNNNIE